MTAIEVVRSVFGDAAVGMIAYVRSPQQGKSWGPFNGQAGRLAIFDALMACSRPTAIVETGTYRGTTTEVLAKSGLPVFTIEQNDFNFGFSWARLRRLGNVRIFRGDSRAVLSAIIKKHERLRAGEVVFAYLDAHWNADLPLSQEIDIVFSHMPRSLVMVDDFQVPFDPGYGFDDYGPGKALTADYLVDVVAKHKLDLFYPRLPSAQETGSKRGCVVIARADIHGAALRSEPLLRLADE